MSKAIETIKTAQEKAMKIRPKVGGFPYLAEVMRQAGVIRNLWELPSCQCMFLTNDGPVVMQGTPLLTGFSDIPKFDREALIHAIRTDQKGESTFPEFIAASWKAGVTSYEVDFHKRHVIYYGCNGESYLEDYPQVAV